MVMHRGLNFEFNEPFSVVLGCFDGVHEGHRQVLRAGVEAAKKLNCRTAVLTFDKPVRAFFAPESVSLISSDDSKLRFFEELGISVCVSLPLTSEILSIDAQDFIEEIVIKKLGAVHVCCGYNYTFGKGARGNAVMLEEICKKHGIGISVVPEYRVDGLSVSSSEIRSLISGGDVKTAAALLGYPYSITSDVVSGQHLARKLGFPTVNVLPEKDMLLPKNGVYLTKTSFDGFSYYGITNVGIRPTVDTGILCAETHMFDFEGDVYGKRITTEFIEFVRSEKKFSSIEEMAAQVRADIEKAKQILHR